MTKTSRARYTLEFKQEAVRLVKGGQNIAAPAKTLGVVDQSLFNWVKAQRRGKLTGADSKVKLTLFRHRLTRFIATGSIVAEIARPTTRCGPLQWFAYEVTPAPGNTSHDAQAKDCPKRRFTAV